MQDQALRDQSRSTTTRDGGWIAGASYLTLAAMGLLLGFPVLIGDLLVRQIAGSMQDAPWAPFGDDADGKTWLSVLIVLVIGVPLVAAAVMISRATRRRISPGKTTTLIHYLASSALILLGILTFRSLTTT
ncbi:hypothetical protein PWY87_28900 [Kribbella solani]|uniref:hypothetical protein n=1 Tax=Kribbella solani TaxID=236067 RepID=UPI0029B708B5|nr:hypothetical protein [Kribbella solani]MDX3005733.1 hypothetical protein [Kribbella solani]